MIGKIDNILSTNQTASLLSAVVEKKLLDYNQLVTW